MRTPTFLLGLGGAVGVAYALAVLLEALVPAVAAHRDFTLWTLVAFALVTAVVCFAAVPVARADDKARLTQYALVATFVRMAVGVGLVAGYRALSDPTDLSYAYSFMVVYAVLTAYETYALVRLSYATAAPRPGGASSPEPKPSPPDVSARREDRPPHPR